MPLDAAVFVIGAGRPSFGGFHRVKILYLFRPALARLLLTGIDKSAVAEVSSI
jgi:hypothetical protein